MVAVMSRGREGYCGSEEGKAMGPMSAKTEPKTLDEVAEWHAAEPKEEA